jgi:TolA-binding protein
LSDLKAIGRESGRMSLQKRKSALHSKKNLADETAAPPASVPLLPAEPNSPVTVTYKESEYGRKLFKAAVKAYQQEDCRTALDLLDRYLADNSASSRAADANLYKAECYMKLSAQ